MQEVTGFLSGAEHGTLEKEILPDEARGLSALPGGKLLPVASISNASNINEIRYLPTILHEKSQDSHTPRWTTA
ncbi:hypothetical protein G3257_15965 [Janthinobacterium lividum]|uniref:hypothetical protein n=1 Tax=Janthinobacterium lividum TaxID=29581 RepID=UPI00159573A6|nr:hypothetical protein [Janthinobacterium lividum]QKY03601.1 hypothetical protein G3257_15965 [Janthinobacterium lividum]